ncbi:MAG: VanZ family protein [Eubacteriales bacterium]|nr:VanZ family protein [Eubacteriales bacterium]
MDFFFSMLLIILGYFTLLSIVMIRSENKRVISNLAGCVLLIYGCIVGMFIAVGRYLGEAGLILYAVAIIYSCLFSVWKIYMIIREKPQFQIGVLLTFIAYIFAVLYITTFMREGGSNSAVQMELLNWMQDDGLENFNHFLLNIALFIPLGLLFPLITSGCYKKKFLSAVSFGLLFTVVIETGQLIMHSGTCDIDDILSNTIGTALGALAVEIWRARERKKHRIEE